ncbi:hypothetical protein SAMN05660226_02801 [Parapedobacter luteus]|uniref:Uncharacterized protein n=1 Tax=Parapedobacter luteus TaxID=623280 RepID=A0A1T5DGM8_9SPHI|nr:hypothetical protein SAMN05660226_02801 [Parapedobacter luteus]
MGSAEVREGFCCSGVGLWPIYREYRIFILAINHKNLKAVSVETLACLYCLLKRRVD